MLAAGQLGGIFGAFKTLKTSLAADLLISLASGTAFLGRFPVSQSGRVLFLSGEAGLPATKSLAGRICAERGLSLDALENFVCSPDVPNLSDPFDAMAFTELVEREKPICVVIDPSFLALGGGRGGRGGARGGNSGKKSRSLFETGRLLRPLVELCESTGCAILIVHHSPRSRRAGEPAMLDDLAGSGVAEFSDQWLLVSRRQPFDVGTGQDGTGHHELWLTTGSGAGEQGLWELDVDEPALEQGAVPTQAGSRRWKTAVRPATSPQLQTDTQFVADREDRNLRRRALAFERQSQRTLELLAAYPDGRTARFIRDTLGMSGDRINRLLDRLIEKGVVVRTEDRIIDRRRPIVTYSRVQAVDLSAEAIRAARTARSKSVRHRDGTLPGQVRPAPNMVGRVSPPRTDCRVGTRDPELGRDTRDTCSIKSPPQWISAASVRTLSKSARRPPRVGQIPRLGQVRRRKPRDGTRDRTLDRSGRTPSGRDAANMTA